MIHFLGCNNGHHFPTSVAYSLAKAMENLLPKEEPGSERHPACLTKSGAMPWE